MITGDKQETAINIAVACRLVLRPKALLRCNAPGSAEAAAARLSELLAQADREAANGAKARGMALGHAPEHPGSFCPVSHLDITYAGRRSGDGERWPHAQSRARQA